MKETINKKIDELLQIRQEGIFNYSKATNELIEMGVKIGKKDSGDLTIPASFEPYIDQYNESNLEFEWQAIYDDGTALDQFEDGEQMSFKDIDISKLEAIQFISNFTWPTDNFEKRVIVRLNFKTGLFEFLNGFAPQEVVNYACVNPIEGEKKLILFCRKRFSSTIGEINERYKDFYPSPDEFFYFNRFVLGYEANGEKKALIIQPNGVIGIFAD